MRKNFSILTAVFAVLVFLISCGGSEGSGNDGQGGSGEAGSIYGVVSDRATGELIRKASVELKDSGSRTVGSYDTGSDGQFDFNELTSGTYTLYVTKAGYIDQTSGEIIVEAGKRTQRDVSLEKAPAALQILIEGKEGSELDFGAEIDVVERQFDIKNNGEEKLNWIISYSADWIKEVRPDEGELKAFGKQGVIVTIDRSLLESGPNTTKIHVTSNDGNKELTVKATNATSLPTLNTLEATNITSSTAVLNAEILTKGVPSYSKRGFVYALTSMPTLEDTLGELTAKVTEENKYSALATGLELGKEYYVRGYAINEAGVAYSTNEVKFVPEMGLPNVTTEESTNINLDLGTATFNGTIVDEGDPAYRERGFVYGFTHNPSIDDTKKEVIGSGLGKFSANVSGFEFGKVYYVRAYAINDKGAAYGQEITLDFKGTLPIVKTSEATNISIGSQVATFNGTIVGEGNPAYTERGFVYATIHNPTVEDNTKKQVTGDGTGAFSANVTGLEMNKTYYIRAYAINAVGSAYGEEIILDFNAVMPVVNTNVVTARNIGGGSATFNGTIVKIGDPAYTERGFVYALTHNPSTDDTKKIVAGDGTGAFSANVTGLSMDQIYYIRAYATNVEGTVYGAEVELDMTGTRPVVSTNAVSGISIGSGAATFKGTIEELGDPAYTERGFVYALTHNPTIEDDTKKIATGSGTGAFSANITNLVMNNTYYIRAYATNLEGTAYGNEVTLDFNPVYASVETNDVSNIDATTATLRGNITALGDPAYTERGFVYAKTPNPTTLSNKVTVSGSGSGTFTKDLTGLETQVTYYVKAYVISNNNIMYGSEVTFYTESPYYYVLKSAGLMVAKHDSKENDAYFSEATSLCENSTLAGFEDWRLPTKNELVTVYNNKDLIGNFESEVYWSSTPMDSTYTWCVDFRDGDIDGYKKSYGYYVRCVRSLTAAVVTESVSNVDLTSATLNATVTSVGEPAYTERGFVYGKNPNPTVADNKVTVSGSGVGTYTFDLTGLETRVTYYVKSYVISNNNVIYGNEVHFYTESPYYYVLKDAGIMVQKNDITTAANNWSTSKTMIASSTLGGFSDWRLPTITELSLLYQNREIIGGFQVVREPSSCLDRGFIPIYWSSTQGSNSGNYKVVTFNTGQITDAVATQSSWLVEDKIYVSGCSYYSDVEIHSYARAVRTILDGDI